MIHAQIPQPGPTPVPRQGNDALAGLLTAFQQRRTLAISGGVLFFLLILEFVAAHSFITASGHLFLLFIIFFLCDLLVATLLGWLTAVPLAILVYMRAVQKEQQTNSKVYTPLMAVKNLYETPPDAANQPEQRPIGDIAREQQTHLLILGLPGAGKTMALRAAYLFPLFNRYWSLLRGQERIPLYVPMRDYNAFLGRTNPTPVVVPTPGIAPQAQHVEPLAYPASILTYLLADNGLTGMQHLRPYVAMLARRGRLLFLCDGLNEVDHERLGFVCGELLSTMQGQRNRLAMTCRELDYREGPVLRQLVGADYAQEALILPLRTDQIKGFVEQYVQHAQEQVGPRRKYSAYEINQRIEHSRLSYNCTNPMMLVTLIETIDEVGPEDQDVSIGTRGRILSKHISRLVTTELQRQGWKLITEPDAVLFLSQVACTARRGKLRNAIQLGRAAPAGAVAPRSVPIPELADRLQLWLDEHALPEQDVTGQYVHRPPLHKAYTHDDIEQLVLFAQGAGLITVSYNGVLSFGHELLAEYFAANYLHAIDTDPQAPIPFGNELIADIGSWSEPVAMWAGMSTDPMGLAKRLANLALSQTQYSYNALSLSLVCVGVRWSPQPEKHAPPLPENVSQLLIKAVYDTDQRARLAETLRRSADEGGIEVYRSLLPLLMEAHIDDLLLLLDKRMVPDLLFDYLCDAVETAMSHEYIQHLVRILGRFGEVAIPRAVELSQAQPDRTTYLRVEALHVLGGTNSQQAVQPLIGYLSDDERTIIEAAVNALVNLGPGLALEAVITELKSQVPRDLIERIHWAALAVLQGLLMRNTLNAAQYQRTIESLTLALSSLHRPTIQQEAKRIVLQQADPRTNKQGDLWKKVVEALLRSLADHDETRATNLQEVLQQVGILATPLLLTELERSRWELVKARIIHVLRTVHDPNALQPLLHFLDDPSPLVRQETAAALRDYAPQSIPFLINLVLFHKTPRTAESASVILQEIGTPSVPLVIKELEQRIVPRRTQLLVQVLVQVHDARAVRPLIGLLQRLHNEPDDALAEVVIWALGNFRERQVVAPLLEVLTTWRALLAQKASQELSSFGELALPELIAALDVKEEGTGVQRVRTTLLQMQPFLAAPLLHAISSCSEAQARQLELIFIQKGDMAPFLVANLSHALPRVRTFVHTLLGKMAPTQTIEPLIDALKNPGEIEVIADFLLKYQQSIPPLVNRLDDARRSDAAVTILLRFGNDVIPHLVPGLNHTTSPEARTRASTILVRLVRQERTAEAQRQVLVQVIGLFAPAQRGSPAWYAVLDIVANQFAELSPPLLLQGLEDGKLLDGCAEALMHLARTNDAQKKRVVHELLAALHTKERKTGAAETLIRLEADAVEPVSGLVVDGDEAVASKAQEILSRIGPAALRFVWNNYRNTDNARLQQAAHKIFSDMPTERIQGELIRLLVSEESVDGEMALALLQERIAVEGKKPPQDQKVVAALLEYVQTHGRVNTNLRVIAVLLLQRKEVVIPQLVFVLRNVENPQQWQWLAQMFLVLGREGGEVEKVLWEIVQDSDARPELRREVMSIIGLLGLNVENDATSLNQHSPLSQQPGRPTIDLQQLEALELPLRALGGLLASGKWNSKRLYELLQGIRAGDPRYDLYSVLLGRHFSTQVAQLGQQLREQRNTHEQQLQAAQEAWEQEKQKLSRKITDQAGEVRSLKQNNNTLKQQRDDFKQERDYYAAEVTRLQQPKPPIPPWQNQQNQGLPNEDA